jgi:hypothetical protein
VEKREVMDWRKSRVKSVKREKRGCGRKLVWVKGGRKLGMLRVGKRGTIDENRNLAIGLAMPWKALSYMTMSFFFTRLTEFLETSLFSFSFQNLYALYFGIKQSLVMLWLVFSSQAALALQTNWNEALRHYFTHTE